MRDAIAGIDLTAHDARGICNALNTGTKQRLGGQPTSTNLTSSSVSTLAPFTLPHIARRFVWRWVRGMLRNGVMQPVCFGKRETSSNHPASAESVGETDAPNSVV